MCIDINEYFHLSSLNVSSFSSPHLLLHLENKYSNDFCSICTTHFIWNHITKGILVANLSFDFLL